MMQKWADLLDGEVEKQKTTLSEKVA
jgi:hypothetical protein